MAVAQGPRRYPVGPCWCPCRSERGRRAEARTIADGDIVRWPACRAPT